MMAKELLLWMAVLISSLLIACQAQEASYVSKYDDVDIDMILANDKLRNQYLVCYFDVTLCATADAKYFHDKFSEAIITKCQKCTPKQVEILDKVTDWYTKNEPESWKRIVEKSLEDMKRENA